LSVTHEDSPMNDIESEERLSDVIGQMRELGAPTIYYVTVDGLNYAMNGSHRLFAASILGIAPKFIKLEYDGKRRGGGLHQCLRLRTVSMTMNFIMRTATTRTVTCWRMYSGRMVSHFFTF
jgi:hypothetical protein